MVKEGGVSMKKEGSHLKIPVRPAGARLERRNAAAGERIHPARALTNEQIIQQQGETFVLMYNEISQLRKEIRTIRSNDRPSMLSGTRNLSPWAMRDPFRKLEPDAVISIFPDGSDRDMEYGHMPVAARNVLSDPDLEQFTRDAIYMLHRQLSQIRKDVDHFKLHGDPALLAALKAGDDATEALAVCANICTQHKTKDEVYMQQIDHLSETVQYHRHDMLERLKKAQEEQCSAKFAAVDLEFQRMHIDVDNLAQNVQHVKSRDVDTLKGVAVCCSVLQCVAVCCSVLHCVAVCCSVLRCVAACSSETCSETCTMPFRGMRTR